MRARHLIRGRFEERITVVDADGGAVADVLLDIQNGSRRGY